MQNRAIRNKHTILKHNILLNILLVSHILSVTITLFTVKKRVIIDTKSYYEQAKPKVFCVGKVHFLLNILLVNNIFLLDILCPCLGSLVFILVYIVIFMFLPG